MENRLYQLIINLFNETVYQKIADFVKYDRMIKSITADSTYSERQKKYFKRLIRLLEKERIPFERVALIINELGKIIDDYISESL